MTDNAFGSLTTNAAATSGRALDAAADDNSPAAIAAVAQGNAAPLAVTVPIVGAPIATSDPAHLAAIGATMQDPTTQAARASLMGRGILGFDAAVGLLRHSFVPASLVADIRRRLAPMDRHGFHVGSALHIGRVIAPHDPNAPPDAWAAHAIRHGVLGLPAATAVGIVNTAAAQSPNAVTGAQLANKRIDAAKAEHAKSGIGIADVALVGVGLAAGGWWWGLAGAGIGAAVGGAVDAIRRHFTK